MLIGTDPEYIMFNPSRGYVVGASGICEFDSCSAKVGCDGAGTPLEVRPNPTLLHMMEPFCRRLDDLLKYAANYCVNHDYELWGGSRVEGYSIGGHVHFGSNMFIGRDNEARKRRKTFGKKVDLFFLPIINTFISGSEIRARSGNSSYGKLGDIRTQRYGIEYRTPYSFPVSPFHNRAFFNILSIIAANHRKIKIDRKLWKRIRRYYDGEFHTSHMRYVYKRIKPKLLKLMKYNSPNPKLNPYTLTLFSLIENRKKANMELCSNFNLNEPDPYVKIITSGDDFLGEPYFKRIFGRDNIKIEGDGSIYIYGVAKRPVETDAYQMFLGDGMPMIENSRWLPPSIKVKYKKFGSAFDKDYTIGLSWNLRRDIYDNVISPKFLINYIKNQVKRLF